METNKIIMGVVALAVGAVIFAGMLPAFAETTSATDTFYNDGYYRMSKIGTDTDLTLVWDHTDPNKLTINGETYTFPNDIKDSTLSIIPDTNFTVRGIWDENGVLSTIQYYLSTGGANTAKITDSTDFSMSASGGTASFTIGGTTKTASYDIIYYPDSNGKYIMKYSTTDAYVNKDSDFFACGTSQVYDHDGQRIGSQILGTEITGSIADGMNVNLWRTATSGTATITVKSDSEVIEYSTVASYNDLYTIGALKYTAVLTETVDDETVDTDNPITYTYYIVPYAVTAEKAIHPDGTSSAILNVLPLLIVIGLVMGAAGCFIVLKK